MIRFSRNEDFAVIILNTLSKNYQKRLVPLSEIANEYKISLLYLRNLANKLKHADLISAVEGKNGGYFLIKAPEKITMGDVLSVFSGKPLLPCCDYGHQKATCDKMSICDVGRVWRKLNQDFLTKISSLTLKEFVTYNG